MDDLELIKQKINIVDLIQEYLPLKKTGINFKANCPFHQEKTPSFVVSPDRGIWHCFGCDKGGDIFKFIMEKESLGFKEALELLAQKAGVALKSSNKEKKSSDRLFEANEKTVQFYHYLLTENPLGKKALEYLEKRGIQKDMISQFQIGYSAQNWEVLAKFLKKRGFKDKDLIESGLCVASQRGCYDRFRGRIMFPLIDYRKRVVGFAGRILASGGPPKTSLADGGPKYINTPQTEIFDKSNFLFGLHLSKESIRQKNEAIVVEGEMDMIMSYQSGVKNIVASKGTALTEGQIALIKKYTDTVSLSFDTDLAGDAAARRGIEIADKAGLNIKVIKITGGKDAGEVCQKNPDLWKKCVEEAVPIYDYYIESATRRFDAKTSLGKRNIFLELIPIWSKISDVMTKEHYIQRLSAILQVKDELIRSQIQNYLKQKNDKISIQIAVPPKKDDQVVHKDRRHSLEEYLIILLLHLPPAYNFVPNFSESLFTQENLKQIYIFMVIYLDSIAFKSKAFKIQEFIKLLPKEYTDYVDQLFLKEIDEKLEDSKKWQKEIDLVISELKKMLIKSSLEKLSLQIKSAQSLEKADTLTALNKRFRDLSVKLRNL